MAYDLKAWLKDRLPDGVSFTKNGVTRTIDEAIGNALAFYAHKAEPHLWAAYDLWDQIRATYSDIASSDVTADTDTFESESLDGWSYKTITRTTATDRMKRAKDLAEQYKAMAEASDLAFTSRVEATAGVGSFQMVTGTYSRSCASDENSR